MVTLRYTVLFVGDLAKAISFYRDAVGLALRNESRDSAEFEAGSTAFVLHQAHQDHIASHQPTRAGKGRLGFHVDDLDAAHARVVAGGGRCLVAPEVKERARMGL